MNLVQKALNSGGRIAPVIIPAEVTGSTGLMNPSVFIDSDGDILVNLRHVNYTFYHAENSKRFPTIWGPLSYLHPEHDQRLVTENYFLRLNDDLEVTDYTKVEMLNLHEPIWEFVGLEDARVVKWDDEYYLTGVRRDTTTNGQGRMELSKISLDKKSWKVNEVSRRRIPTPDLIDTYCEKNWMPVLDQPFHFVKWTSPTELVVAHEDYTERKALTTEAANVGEQRGSSQVIPWGDHYIAISHEVGLYLNYLGQKDGLYTHRVCVWDKSFNLIGVSNKFSFLNGMIEFCVGLAQKDNKVLISFGFQDNAAFILEAPTSLMDELVEEALANGIN
jgi:hypothetical protein